MEKAWKLSKIIAFILSITAFAYVGYLISQKGRYQPISNAVLTAVIDTQTGIIYLYSRDNNTYYKYDSQNQSMKIKTTETDTLLAK